MKKNIYRVVTRKPDGQLFTQDFPDLSEIKSKYRQIGVDNCSMENSLRGLPMFHGLIGPLGEGATIVRYETPEVFEILTQEWFQAEPMPRSRKKDI